MGVWVALLRGINVGQAKRVPMAVLRDTIESLGFSDPATVLNSGNVIFGATATPDPEAIRAAVKRATGVDAEVVVLSAERFRALAEGNPLRRDDREAKHLGVAFAAAPLAPVAAPPGIEPEELVVTEGAVYQWLPNGVLASPVPPSFWKALGASVTARNDATVRKIVVLLDKR